MQVMADVLIVVRRWAKPITRDSTAIIAAAAGVTSPAILVVLLGQPAALAAWLVLPDRKDL